MSFPPLPSHPERLTQRWSEEEAKVLKAYGKACREQALEDAAKVLEVIEAGYGVTDKGLPDAEYARMKQTAREHQTAIRRLK